MTHGIGITTLEDISTLILQSHDLDETLNNIVALVARRAGVEVCSLYLLDNERSRLNLRASQGLAPQSVGRVSMGIDEGLTGLAIEQRRVVAMTEPQKHPRYRYFAETGEERYHSFLGIPLFDRRTPMGVLVIQTRKPRVFTQEEVSALSTIAFQVSSIVVNARLLDSIAKNGDEAGEQGASLAPPSSSVVSQHAVQDGPLRGTMAYPGVTSGKAQLVNQEMGLFDGVREGLLEPHEELARLEQALERARIQTIMLEKRVAERLSREDAAIFQAHLMILEDHSFLEKIRERIRSGIGAFQAVQKTVGTYVAAFDHMEDPYLRERAADLRDIGRRLLSHLVGSDEPKLALEHEGILVAQELLPSDMAMLDHEKVKGLIIEAAEKNAHAVIMAKSLGIPALVGVAKARDRIAPGDRLILDANSACVYINPPQQIAEEYRRLQEDCQQELQQLDGYRKLPAETADGIRVILRANIGLLSDVAVALRNGAEGVGLYRTEFPYMIRTDFPDRDDQYRLYRTVVERFDGLPVTIRTLDIGGDKRLPYFSPPQEENPFMGWRSVRFALDNRDIFRTQIEAILMAGRHGPVKLLFPMITELEEVRACKGIVAEAQEQLRASGVAYSEEVPIGVMIEVPAAVRLASVIAEEVDFFALGTNDLIQYMLASDRNNPLVKKYYNPLHPSVLKVLQEVVEVALAKKKGLCLCGEMATEPGHLLLLFGMGIREFSMAAPFIPRVKKFLQSFTSGFAEKTTEEVMGLGDSSEIQDLLNRRLKEGTGGDSLRRH